MELSCRGETGESDGRREVRTEKLESEMNPPDLTLREKEASVVRGEMKIRDNRSVTVRYLRVRAESMLDSKGLDSSTMYIFLFEKVGQDWAIGLFIGYRREL